MKNRTSKWIGAWMLVVGGCDPFPDEEDTGSEDSSDSGNISATSTTGVADEGGSVSVTSWGEEGGETTTSTGTTSHGSGESCSVTVGESTVSATTNGGSEDDGSPGDDDGSNTSGGSPLEACGVELEFVDVNNSFICGCEECNVQYDGLTPESAEDFLDACVCICEAVGCGGSVSGGVTGEVGEDGEGTASGTSDGGEDDGGSEVTGSEVTGKYEDG
ncbi:MAG: hypothetical protein IAG13_25585 [Deltaproteobacteria bacterium]|nr:hypothetical protein [Nannocystaceae bacterium]